MLHIEVLAPKALEAFGAAVPEPAWPGTPPRRQLPLSVIAHLLKDGSFPSPSPARPASSSEL